MAATTEAAAGAWGNHAAEQRRRVNALLDAATPGRSLAVRRCMLALETFQSDGHMREARVLLRDALVCNNVHHPTIYRAWIAMEEHAGSGAAAGVRELFEGWLGWCHGHRGEDEAAFWCHYIAFELRHGTAASLRAVAERAVAACPRDPAVHAKYARAELHLGCPDRVSDVLGRARSVFAAEADAGAWEKLMDEVAGYRDAMRGGSWRRLRGHLPFCRRRSRSAAQGYERIGVA